MSETRVSHNFRALSTSHDSTREQPFLIFFPLPAHCHENKGGEAERNYGNLKSDDCFRDWWVSQPAEAFTFPGLAGFLRALCKLHRDLSFKSGYKLIQAVSHLF